jgi:hypothetical protein
MSTRAIQIVEKIENQISQVILYIGAIDALSETYRSCTKLREDPFLFHTVYESLWDGVIARIGTVWDGTKGVASFPQLSKELKRIGSPSLLAVAREIDNAASPERARLKEWRNSVVAHSSLTLDPVAFDMENGINAKGARQEANRIEQLLQSVNTSIGRSPVYYEVLKEDAMVNARGSLQKWSGDGA